MSISRFSLLSLIVTAMLTYSLLCGCCCAATYYLSPAGSDSDGDGSVVSPWFSPLKARKSTGSITVGDTIVFLSGYYNYDSSTCLLGYSGDDSGMDSAQIVYKAQTVGQVTLDFGGGYGWRLQQTFGASNIILDGFIIVNCRIGVTLDDAKCVVGNTKITATSTWPPSGDVCAGTGGGAGIVTFLGALDFQVRNCICDHNSDDASGHGFYCSGGRGVIGNSIFRNNVGNGIQIQASSPSHNIFDIYVFGNKVYNNSGSHGIYMSGYNGGCVESAIVVNNLISQNGHEYASGYGITANAGVKSVKCLNNTLYDNHYGLNIQALSGIMQNNISVVSTSGDISWGTSQNVNLIKSNNLTTTGTENANYGVSGAFAVSDFISINPEHVDFLKIKESALNAVDAGIDTGVVFVDFFGNLRDDGAIDIGAIEVIHSVAKPSPPSNFIFIQSF